MLSLSTSFGYTGYPISHVISLTIFVLQIHACLLNVAVYLLSHTSVSQFESIEYFVILCFPFAFRTLTFRPRQSSDFRKQDIN